jgi:hypothetical protein
MISLCRGWRFTEEWSEDFLRGKKLTKGERLT